MKCLKSSLNWIVWVACLGASLACQSGGQEAKGKDKTSQINTLLMEWESSVEFYGKVIDQYGKPVEGAKVDLLINRYSSDPARYFMTAEKAESMTGRNGDFKFTAWRGLGLSVEKIEKKGYEYDRHRAISERSGEADYRRGQKPKASNPQTPALFYMRKVGESTFIFHSDGGFVFKAEDSGTEQAFDVIRHDDFKGNDLKTLMLGGDALYPDLKVKATWDPKAGVWNVEISGGKPGDGLMVLGQKLYEAPAEGYLANFTFQITTTQPDKLPLVTIGGNPSRRIQLTWESSVPDSQIMYIYLRSREPAIYTRLIFQYPRTVRQDYLNMGGLVDTNPYGERNLEPTVSLPVDVKLKLEEDIRSAFRDYGRPQKPDLPKLVSQWEKSRPLTEKIKDMFKR